MLDGHNKKLDELTRKRDVAVGRAEGLLPVVRCVTLETKDLSENDRIEYAARLMYFGFEQAEVAERLEKLVKNPEGHEEHHAARFRNRPQGAVEAKLNPREFDAVMAEKKATIGCQIACLLFAVVEIRIALQFLMRGYAGGVYARLRVHLQRLQ
jgi:hypothetical protein